MSTMCILRSLCFRFWDLIETFVTINTILNQTEKKKYKTKKNNFCRCFQGFVLPDISINYVIILLESTLKKNNF